MGMTFEPEGRFPTKTNDSRSRLCLPERDRLRIKSGGDKPGDDQRAATTLAPGLPHDLLDAPAR
jgi:hypothetical protein